MTATRKWIALTGAVIALIFVTGWMVVLKPVLGQANSLQNERVAQEVANDGTRARIVLLQQQAKELEAQAKQVEDLQARIPATVQLPTIIRQLAAKASEAGVTVDGISPASPVDMAASGVQPTAATDGTVAPPSQEPLYMVGVTVNTTGTFAAQEAILRELEGMRRAFLVSGITVRPAETAVEGELPPDALSMTITGRVFTRSPNTSGAGVGSQSGSSVTPPPDPTSTIGGVS